MGDYSRKLVIRGSEYRHSSDFVKQSQAEVADKLHARNSDIVRKAREAKTLRNKIAKKKRRAEKLAIKQIKKEGN